MGLGGLCQENLPLFTISSTDGSNDKDANE
jgi:hypothetical protein